MKRTILLIIPLLLLFVSCRKQDMVRPPVDESQWLRKERAYVVSSDISCSYFVVETMRGYAVIRMWGGTPPFQGSVLYGDFSYFGVGTFYNRSEGYLFSADVRDWGLTYFAAMDDMDYYCGYY